LKIAGPDLRSVQDKVIAGQYDVALTALADLLQSDPENPEALYMSAVCRRCKRDFEPALDCLDRLKSVAPEHGRAYQEEGHVYRDMGRDDDALLAYSRACRYNAALEASWREQLRILSARGMHRQAVQVGARLEHLQELPPPLVAVMDLVGQGRLLKAEELCRAFLRKMPQHVEGMRLLADIGVRLGVLDDAEFLLESALKFEPDNMAARMDYIQVLRKRQKVERAVEEAERLLDAAPNSPQVQSLFAIQCLQADDYERAQAAFDQVLAQLPGDPVTLTSKGHAYKTCGHYDIAVDTYHAAIASHPAHGEAWYSLANLKVYTFTDDEIREMQAREGDRKLPHTDRIYLCFALGKAFEDRGDFAAAFDYYARGNRLKKAQSRYDAEHMSADLAAQRRVCTRPFFEQRQSWGHDARDPIFILGLPRAGSTLLEQILSSHSLVDGTRELPNILALSQRLRRRGRRGNASDYPQILGELQHAELADFGRQFIDDTRIHRESAPHFIDKMPNNFRHIGLIHLILPNAKIIDARRHPMSCCFSGFKQLFAEGQDFTYSLEDAGRYYRDYVALMDHWDEVLPGKVLRVQYEDVVADLEGQVRRILEYCELPFEASCLQYHETERSVRTPSSEQVRQPIYDSALEPWRPFAARLGPLQDALGPLLERYPVR
jgi:tetratricopeptide (TPR) repeat protein